MPKNHWLEHKKSLQQQHQQMILPGLHMGKPAVSSGNPTAAIVHDLLSEGHDTAYMDIDLLSDMIEAELVFLHSQNNPDEAHRIRTFISRFLGIVSMDIPLVGQRTFLKLIGISWRGMT